MSALRINVHFNRNFLVPQCLKIPNAVVNINDIVIGRMCYIGRWRIPRHLQFVRVLVDEFLWWIFAQQIAPGVTMC